ncbi:MAG: hypothetical protein ACI8PP_000284 [Candidatus Pseudothioglobus sp.]|jgi:hypothetical protein
MNIIEKQTELTKSLYAINTTAMKEFATMQQENLQKYIETNRSFGEKLPEVKDISSFVELQREYSATLWSNVKDSFEHQNELFRSAMEETRDAVKHAFTSEDVVEDMPVVKAKPKAKAKTKAKAKAAVAE